MRRGFALLLLLGILAGGASSRAGDFSPKSEDFYERLGVPRSASDYDIKKAYRRAAMKYHPDRVGTEEREEFQNLKEAYENLGTAELRAKYNADHPAPKVRQPSFAERAQSIIRRKPELATAPWAGVAPRIENSYQLYAFVHVASSPESALAKSPAIQRVLLAIQNRYQAELLAWALKLEGTPNLEALEAALSRVGSQASLESAKESLNIKTSLAARNVFSRRGINGAGFKGVSGLESELELEGLGFILDHAPIRGLSAKDWNDSYYPEITAALRGIQSRFELKTYEAFLTANFKKPVEGYRGLAPTYKNLIRPYVSRLRTHEQLAAFTSLFEGPGLELIGRNYDWRTGQVNPVLTQIFERILRGELTGSTVCGAYVEARLRKLTEKGF